MNRLRKYIREATHHRIAEYIDASTMPMFGFPPICYNESTGEKQYLNVLLKHIFPLLEDMPKVSDFINEAEALQKWERDLPKKWTIGWQYYEDHLLAL